MSQPQSDRRRQGSGYSNSDHSSDGRSGGHGGPYDASKEVVLSEEGRIPLDRDGNLNIVVEYVTYDNGPMQMRMRKLGVGRDGGPIDSRNPGKLWGDQCDALSKLLAAATIKLNEDRAKRAAPRDADRRRQQR